MCARMFVCVYAYVCICSVCPGVYACLVCVCVRTRIVCACMCVHVCASVCACVSLHAPVYVCLHVCKPIMCVVCVHMLIHSFKGGVPSAWLPQHWCSCFPLLKSWPRGGAYCPWQCTVHWSGGLPHRLSQQWLLHSQLWSCWECWSTLPRYDSSTAHCGVYIHSRVSCLCTRYS